MHLGFMNLSHNYSATLFIQCIDQLLWKEQTLVRNNFVILSLHKASRFFAGNILKLERCSFWSICTPKLTTSTQDINSKGSSSFILFVSSLSKLYQFQYRLNWARNSSLRPLWNEFNFGLHFLNIFTQTKYLNGWHLYSIESFNRSDVVFPQTKLLEAYKSHSCCFLDDVRIIIVIWIKKLILSHKV